MAAPPEWPAHVLTTPARVYLQMGPEGRWEIDRVTCDGYPLDGAQDPVATSWCRCGAPGECRAAARAADEVAVPDAAALYRLLAAALGEPTRLPPAGAEPWPGRGAWGHYIEECAEVGLRMGADGQWHLWPQPTGEPLDGYSNGAHADECQCGDEAACDAAVARASQVELPTPRELHGLLREALAQEADTQAAGEPATDTPMEEEL